MQVDLCEAMADIISVEQRQLDLEKRADVHRLEDEAFQAMKDRKPARADMVHTPPLPFISSSVPITHTRSWFLSVTQHMSLVFFVFLHC